MQWVRSVAVMGVMLWAMVGAAVGVGRLRSQPAVQFTRWEESGIATYNVDPVLGHTYRTEQPHNYRTPIMVTSFPSPDGQHVAERTCSRSENYHQADCTLEVSGGQLELIAERIADKRNSVFWSPSGTKFYFMGGESPENQRNNLLYVYSIGDQSVMRVMALVRTVDCHSNSGWCAIHRQTHTDMLNTETGQIQSLAGEVWYGYVRWLENPSNILYHRSHPANEKLVFRNLTTMQEDIIFEWGREDKSIHYIVDGPNIAIHSGTQILVGRLEPPYELQPVSGSFEVSNLHWQWSPSGTDVIFTGQQSEGQNLNLYLASPHIAEPLQLTNFENATSIDSRWSPDGRWLATLIRQQTPGTNSPHTVQRLFLVPTDGSQRIRSVPLHFGWEIGSVQTGYGWRIPETQ